MKRPLIAILLLLLMLAPACRRREDLTDRVKRFLTNTEKVSRKFVWEVEPREGTPAQVVGQVEDSFRIQATLRLNSKDVGELLLDDDAVAIRVIDPNSVVGAAAAGLSSSKIITDSLLTGRWILDPSGAPPLRRQPTVETGPGSEITEAMDVLHHIRVALDDAATVKIWSEDDLEPAYLADEDHFPHPDEDASERRYDLVRPPIPVPAAGTQAGGVEEVPKVSMFRKMAIYVRGERIVRVLEDVDIDGHPDFVDARAKKKKRMLELLDQVLTLKGADAITQRKMSVVFTDLGGKIAVRQPADALKAPLDGLFGPPTAGNIEDAIPAEASEPAPA